MSLTTATTDVEAINGLVTQVTSLAAAGNYGRSRRQSFGDSTSGRRNRRRLRWGFAQCLAWYRADGRDLCGDGANVEAVRARVSSYLVSMFAGWVLSILAGWLLDLIVEAFLRWILSDDSAAFRAAVEGH